MAFQDMIREIHGCVPKIPVDYARTLVNRAWRDVRRQNLWSFLLYDGNWTSPRIINTGHTTTTQGATTVIVDATAATAINAAGLLPTPVTQRQFRIGVGTIYNIWGWDGATTLTLDRPMNESSQVAASYQIVQLYYPAPFADHLVWISVRDMVQNIDLCTDKTRAMLDRMDRQRLSYTMPTDVVAYTIDQNPLSSTYGNMLYELHGTPLAQLTYQLYGVRRGADMVNPSDKLPPIIGEDVVTALARKYAYEWAEANKGDSPRNVGADFRFLIGEAKSDYDRLFRQYRKDDREIVDSWFQLRSNVNFGRAYATYNTISGWATTGGVL